MRINKFVAQATGLSRRAADQAIAAGSVRLNGSTAITGQTVGTGDTLTIGGKTYRYETVISGNPPLTIMLNKPAGYVVSRAGQGSATIYDLLPAHYHRLKPIGRLDKDSSGLLLLTGDGDLAHRLSHPHYAKRKVYQVSLDKPLQPLHHQMISDHGIMLDDGPSRLQLARLTVAEQGSTGNHHWQVTMHEGRNRQIRRTFAALGYTVVRLHRTQFGDYQLGGLRPGTFTDCHPQA